jgi:hypothetical protein
MRLVSSSSTIGVNIRLAAGDRVVGILQARTLELLDTLELPAYGSAQTNPQGIAISPDGCWLALSEATPGGRISIVDTDNDYLWLLLLLSARRRVIRQQAKWFASA